MTPQEYFLAGLVAGYMLGAAHVAWYWMRSRRESPNS